MRLVWMFVLLLPAILPPGGARAASFDCAKAATVVERALCADPRLSALDERSVAAYGDAAQALGISDDERDPLGALLLQGHVAWTAAKNRCGGAVNCLLQQYQRRIAVLTFQPDPQAPAPLDALVGRYGTVVDPEREMDIMAAPGGRVLVGIRINAADWTCRFSGIGRSDGKGGLIVERADFDGTAQGAHSLHLVPSPLGLHVRHADPRDDVSARFCGAGGSLEYPFPREH